MCLREARWGYTGGVSARHDRVGLHGVHAHPLQPRRALAQQRQRQRDLKQSCTVLSAGTCPSERWPRHDAEVATQQKEHNMWQLCRRPTCTQADGSAPRQCMHDSYISRGQRRALHVDCRWVARPRAPRRHSGMTAGALVQWRGQFGCTRGQCGMRKCALVKGLCSSCTARGQRYECDSDEKTDGRRRTRE
jgi:hypothetical protein